MPDIPLAPYLAGNDRSGGVRDRVIRHRQRMRLPSTPSTVSPTKTPVPTPAAKQAIRQLHEKNETLRRHTAELARANRRLEREVVRRQKGEATILFEREKYRTLFLESRVMQEKLRHVTRQILVAQEDERKRISRELHDEVVQLLVGINVELTTLGQTDAPSGRAIRSKITRAGRLVEKSIRAVHRFARDLRPAVLDDLGLIPALHAFSRNLAAREKLQIELTAFQGVEALDADRRTVLFRVVQEALSNVARHAEATRVTVSIISLNTGFRLEVADNGKSFPVTATFVAPNSKRLGLIGMKERVEMIGGEFTIVSLPGKGTTVRADLPFPDSKRKPQ